MQYCEPHRLILQFVSHKQMDALRKDATILAVLSECLSAWGTLSINPVTWCEQGLRVHLSDLSLEDHQHLASRNKRWVHWLSLRANQVLIVLE